jgi:site-specific DNA recombinase
MSGRQAVLYARISSEDRDQFVPKLPDQLKICSDYAQQHKYDIVEEIVEQPNSSGADPTLPGWLRLLDMINSGEVDVIVTRDPDRLTRDVEKFSVISKVMKANNVRLDPVTRTYEAGHRGDFMMWLDVILADKDRKDLLERTERGKRNKVEAKRIYVNGVPPYGYKTHIVTEVVGDHVLVKERTLHVEPEEAEVVKEIFRLFLSSRSETVTSVAKHLTKKGIAPPGHTRYISKKNHLSADAPWYRQTVQLILERKTYYGLWEYGKTTTHKDGSIAVEVEPIVSKHDWDKAQVKIKERGRRRKRHYVENYPFLLKDIAYCGHCGQPMSCKSDRRTDRPRYYAYWCSKSHVQMGANRCDHGLSYRADMVDEQTWENITRWMDDPIKLKNAHKHYLASLKTQDNPIKEQLGVKKTLIHSKKLKLEKLLDLYLSDDMPKADYIARKNKLEAEMNGYNSEVSELKTELKASDAIVANNNQLKQYIDQIPELLDFANTTGDIQRKAELLKVLGAKVIMYPNGEYKHLSWTLFTKDLASINASDSRLSCVYHVSPSEPKPRIWLSGTLVFKRKFIGVKHQNLDAALVGAS